MNETTMTKAERMVENMMISMAIQEAINQQAIYPDKEQKEAIELMIAALAQQFNPAEA
tara:strand:+ start:1316 stop:1489 length:174 start_codon:yes stop_codon:yes gene_type:complete